MPRRPVTRAASPLLLALLLAGGAAAKDRAHAATGRLFISPMGEPFRSDLDGDPEAAWFAGADTDHDGRISATEFRADALRWFERLDQKHDGEIDPDDIDRYENELVPEIRVADAPRGGGGNRASSERPGGRGGGTGGRGGGMGGHGGGMGGGGFGSHRGGSQGGDAGQDANRTPVARATRQGAARWSYLDFPEPVTAADTNMNRGVDRTEMLAAAAERFATLDKNGDGYLDKRELPRVDTRSSGPAPQRHDPQAAATPDRPRPLGGGDRDED